MLNLDEVKKCREVLGETKSRYLDAIRSAEFAIKNNEAEQEEFDIKGHWEKVKALDFAISILDKVISGELTALKPLDEKEVEQEIILFCNGHYDNEDGDVKVIVGSEFKGLAEYLCSHFSKPVIKWPEKIDTQFVIQRSGDMEYSIKIVHLDGDYIQSKFMNIAMLVQFIYFHAIDYIKALNKEDV